MYRSLYFKIILILIIFIVTVMTVVGAVLFSGVSSYFSSDFQDSMDACFAEDSRLSSAITGALQDGGSAESAATCLEAYSVELGLDENRSYAILDENAVILAASDNFLADEALSVGDTVRLSANILSVMNRKDTQTQRFGEETMDYCVRISGGDSSLLIYIRDTKDETRELNWMLFSVILQALLPGLLFAIVLSFFLAKTITSPIQSLTRGAQQLAEGKFEERIDVRSDDEIGTLTETFNYMQDMLKNTLEQVSGERQKLETVFYYLKDAVVAFRYDGTVMHENTTAQDLFSSAYPEGGELTLSLLLAYCDCSENGNLAEETERRFSEGEETVSVPEIHLGESVFDMNLGHFRYAEEGEQYTGTIAMLHDVTGRYELDRSRREFVANVSHELRTPLTSIKGAAETVLRYPDMPAEMRENFLTMAVEESDRMARIVGDLLVLSRLDNHRTKWEITEFSPAVMLRHVCEVVQNDVKEHHHTLSLHTDDDLPLITADRDRMEQVFLNILTNAIKYTPDGGQIRVRAISDGKLLAVAIQDTGIGIPKEDLPHIFERFYRVEKSRSTGAGGTGLGLAIAKEITEAHGGSVEIISEHNRGTTVTILLPVRCTLPDADEERTTS